MGSTSVVSAVMTGLKRPSSHYRGVIGQLLAYKPATISGTEVTSGLTETNRQP
ncbi:hypothetical protein L838_0446 [Mycobacterium avium MAV_120709_2344]|nr:hypothetical protein L838_0446 [Mycobacterium avium MAV_120709_2344]